jgi:hypothetical protein
MSNPDEEEFKIEQNHKKFSIIISIQEEQLSLILIILSNRPKKFSGFFSLNELRISSKIFQHTTTLFEAKEIIKRTVIKKQLLIDDDEFKAKITFDTGLGYDSIPFPIILFRDSDDKGPRISTLIKKYDNNDNFKDGEDNLKKSFINKLKKNNNTFIQNNIPVNGNNNNVLRASIGNNVNNKILNNVNSNGNIQFNNSMKVLTSSKIFSDNNINNNTRNPILQNNKKLMYKEVDLKNNNLQNGSNNKNINTNKDFLSLNNNILYNIYNNMNENKNINSSFYKDLSKSFSYENNQNQFINTNNIPIIRGVRNNIDNNISESNIIPVQNINNVNNINNLNPMNLQYANTNTNINKPINPPFANPNPYILKNNINNNIPIKPIQPINPINPIQPQDNNKLLPIPNPLPNSKLNPNLNTYNKNLQMPIQQIKVINPAQTQMPIQPQNNQIMFKNNKPVINQAIVADNQSFHTAPIQRNVVQIPNIDQKINQNLLFNDNKRKTYNKINKNENMRLSLSDESDEENNLDNNIDEYNKSGEQPYRFKNLLIHGSKKVKGNLEKFKKNQNLGDYRPSGTKFVSYLKFPETKKNISNKSLTLSTISSSITSGSNRVIGIEKNIIKHPGELEEISSRLQRLLNKKNIKYKIIFRSNFDGDLAQSFHQKCDKIKNTLILIKASGNKRFGGFTSETWDGNDINKKDDNSFIFSIDKMKVYDVIEGENAINCNPDLGPVFVNQIKLLDKFFTQGGTTCKKGMNFKTTEDFEITDGAEKFGVQEVEVYQIK